MANTAQGHDAYLQFGEEVTYGTAVAASRKIEIVSEGIEIINQEIPDPSLYNARSRRARYQAGYHYRGPVVLRANYEGQSSFPFKGLLGGVVTTGPTDSAYTHTEKEAATLPSYTLEMFKNVPAGQCDKLTGARINSATVRARFGEMVLIECDVVAQERLTGQTPTANPANVASCTLGTTGVITRASGSFITDGMWPGDSVAFVSGTGSVPAGATILSRDSATQITISANTTAGTATLSFAHNFPAVLPVLFSQAITYLEGSSDPVADVVIRSLEVAYTNNLDISGQIGTLLVAEPVPNDFVECTWTLEQEFKTKTQMDAAKAFSNRVLQFIFQHPSVIGAGTTKREFELKSSTSVVPKVSQPVQGYGKIFQTSTFKADNNVTDASALVFRNRNALSPA